MMVNPRKFLPDSTTSGHISHIHEISIVTFVNGKISGDAIIDRYKDVWFNVLCNITGQKIPMVTNGFVTS